MVVKTTSKKKHARKNTTNLSSSNASKPSPEEYFSRGKTCKNTSSCADCGSVIYFFGFVGALVYYISASVGFWAGAFGVLKALVWPAMLVFKLLGM